MSLKRMSVGQLADAAAIGADVDYDLTNLEMAQPKEIHAEWTETTVSATISLQVSFDNVIWTDFETPTAVSGNTQKTWTPDRHVPFMRVEVDWTSGAITTLKVYVTSLPYSS